MSRLRPDHRDRPHSWNRAATLRWRPGRGLPLLGLALAALAAPTLQGCGGDDAAEETGPRVSFTVMTRNLYLGAELTDIVFTSSVAELPSKAAAFLETVRASDPVGRMQLVAQEIADANPDLVALQEVEQFRTQTPSNFDLAAPGPPDAAEDLFDFLTLLQTALSERGLRYQAFTHALTDVELPATAAGGGQIDVRMTDRDVILVKEGLAASGEVSRRYARDVPLTLGGSSGVPIRLVRGFHSVDVVVGGVPVTFLGSHLEVGGLAAQFQMEQAAELATYLRGSPARQLVAAGDFNSDAAGTGTTSYATLTATLVDGWLRAAALGMAASTTPAGATCCSSLAAPTFAADTRIDLVLHRGPVRAERAAVVGTDPNRRTAGGLWPSDHAGVVMTLSVTTP